MPGPELIPREIDFDNGVRAWVVDVKRGSAAELVLAALQLQPRPVIAIAGGANQLDKRLEPRLAQLFSRGIARAAAECGAAIVDGGTQAGVMALMGRGVADRGRRSVLLGVAPAGEVTYPGGPAVVDGIPLEMNHTHFALVQAGRWCDELDTADALARGLATDQPAAVTVLAGGGPITAEEVLRSVRRRWPVVVLTGSGGFADQIVDAERDKKRHRNQLTDARLAEILADGRLDAFPANGSPEDLVRKLVGYLRPPTADPAAADAWEQFAWLDANAQAERTDFERLQKSILAFGVWATLLAISQTILAPDNPWLGLQHALLLLVTVGMTILAGVLTRFKPNSRWVLLRGGAEAIKREIYRYRTQVKPYTPEPAGDAGIQLAAEIKKITSRLFATEISELGLGSYTGPIPPKMYGAASEDSGLGRLQPASYVSIRIDDQIRYYELRTTQLDRKLRVVQWATLGLGGAATLLTTFGAPVWVPLSTAIATAATAFLEYQQVGPTLAKYNQALASLHGVRAWWRALPQSEHEANLENLVGSTEEILEAEQSGWVRQMQDALDKRRASEEAAGASGREHTPPLT